MDEIDRNRPAGVITPLLTPFNRDFSIATDLYLEHAAGCLSDGAHYLSPFGTTGEAASHSMRERMEMLELLVSSGTAPASRLMPGTGLCSIEESLTLTRHAMELGCAAVMMLPPHFFANATDEGLHRHFSELLEAIGPADPRVCLYHIPQMTRVGIGPALASRLNEAFPEAVVAYKDSSGDWENTRAVIRAAPGLAVFPASESLMIRAMRLGGGGCISASCNSNVSAIRAMYDTAAQGRYDEAEKHLESLDRHRAALQEGGLIPSLKSLKAHVTGDPRWLTLRPPLEDADPDAGPKLRRTVGHGHTISGVHHDRQ